MNYKSVPSLFFLYFIATIFSSTTSTTTMAFSTTVQTRVPSSHRGVGRAGRKLYSVAASDLHSPVDNDGKSVDGVSNNAFLTTIGFGIPLWIGFILPLTILYQLGKVIISSVLPSTEPEEEEPMIIDSGYVVSEKDDIIPRSERKYDMVLLGATGFTGKLAMSHLAKTYGNDGKNIKWAIAGRSQKKLDEVKTLLAEELQMNDIMNLDTIIVDTTDPTMMPNLVQNTKTVISTAGPFSQYGNFVVEYCAKFGTNYADITGEASWVKTMMSLWSTTAQQTGAKIISMCGCDCIPWDMSVSQIAKKLKNEKDGEELVSVTCMDEFNGGASGGTIATILLGIDGKLPTGPEDKKADPFRLTYDGKVHDDQPVENNLPVSILDCITPWNGRKAYGIPFIMSIVNIETVSWTQALEGRASMTYKEFAIKPDFKSAFVDYFSLIVAYTALLNPVTGYVLRKYVLPKSGEGPSLDDMENNSFLSLYTKGIGSKGSVIESILYYPRCVGYLSTAVMLVESGLAMTLEEDKLPVQGGGFFSPAFGLGDVLLERLTATGIYFATSMDKENNDKEVQQTSLEGKLEEKQQVA